MINRGNMALILLAGVTAPFWLTGCAHPSDSAPSIDKAKQQVSAILDRTLSRESIEDRPPNVLWIVLDACRARQLSCYGYDRPVTPIMDEIARHGTRFARHYAQACFTSLSVPTFLTGRYFVPPCLEEDVVYPPAPFLSEEKLLPQRFRENGYFTWCVTGHPMFSYRTPVAAAFEQFDQLTPARMHVDKVTFEEINEHIQKNLVALRKPYFLYVHAMDTHFPHVVFPPFDRWMPRAAARTVLTESGNEASPVFDRPLTSGEYATLLGAYDGDLAYADYQIARLLVMLHEAGHLNNTIIVISSDHGELLGEARHIGHFSLQLDELLHVPCIIAGPGLQQGQVVTDLTENIDLAPTLAALCRLKVNMDAFEGFSLADRLAGASTPIPRPFAAACVTFLQGLFAFRSKEMLFAYDDTVRTLESVALAPASPDGSPPEMIRTPVSAEAELLSRLTDMRNRKLRYLSRPSPNHYVNVDALTLSAQAQQNTVIYVEGALPGNAERNLNSWMVINNTLWCPPDPEIPPLTVRMPWMPRQQATVHARLAKYADIAGMPSAELRVSLPENPVDIIQRSSLAINKRLVDGAHPPVELFTTRQDTDYLEIHLYPPTSGKWSALTSFRLDFSADTVPAMTVNEVEAMQEQLRALGYVP